jgi:hypothetical protein
MYPVEKPAKPACVNFIKRISVEFINREKNNFIDFNLHKLQIFSDIHFK